MSKENNGPTVRRDLPGEVVAIKNVFITMRDGCRIAARIWLPADANAYPVPAILEYIPYRERDEPIRSYFAGEHADPPEPAPALYHK